MATTAKLTSAQTLNATDILNEEGQCWANNVDRLQQLSRNDSRQPTSSIGAVDHRACSTNTGT